MASVSMTVNGKAVSGEVEGRTLLVDFLRRTLGLTGTHVGCDTSQCGACVVHVDGVSVKSCSVLALAADGATVTSIEGMSTPGMVMSAADLLKHNPAPTEQEVRDWLEGNICRCTGYHNIVKAILAAAATLRGEKIAAE